MTKKNLKIAFITVFTVLVIIFTVQNTQVVEVKFLMWDVSMSRSILVIGLLLIGFILGRITRMSKKHKKAKQQTLSSDS